MNISRALSLSLLANLALAAATARLLLRSPENRTLTPASTSFPAVVTRTIVEVTDSANRGPAPERTSPPSWSDSMAALRRADVPSAIIARVVIEHVAQKWTPLEAGYERQYSNGEIDAKRLAALRDERAQEEERELRAALGDGYLAWDREHTVANMYLGGYTPAENEKDALYRLQKDWLQQLHALEIAQREGRLGDAAFEDQRARAETEFRWKLAGLVGAERVDGLATNDDPLLQVRQDFRELKLSDAQVTALATAHQQWNDARQGMAAHLAETKTVDTAYDGDLRALDRARDEKYRSILGEETFLTWQRAADDRYRVLQTNAQRWNLERAQIDQVYASIRAYDLTMATLQHQADVRAQTGQAVDSANVNRALDAYTRETEQSLRRFLGDERFNAMAQQQVFNLRSANSRSRDHGPR